MHNDKEIHLTCECHSHELHIEREVLPPAFETEPTWYGSFWLRGYGEKNWKWKWRVLWHVLKTGKPYGDELVLTRKHLEELSKYIQEQLKFTEKK